MSTYNIGPGELLTAPAEQTNAPTTSPERVAALRSAENLPTDPAATYGSPFILSAAEWLTLQVYVNDAVSLPTNLETFKNMLGPGAPADLSDFNVLIDCYKNINIHCKEWQVATYPATVSLAYDIVHYAESADQYYNAILKEAAILAKDPTDAGAQQALKAILDALTTKAKTFQDNAKGVWDKIHAFSLQTNDDKNVLMGPDGTGTQSGLLKQYNDKYGATSTAVADLTAKLSDLRDLLKRDTDEYNHDCLVAETTPTYAWMFPFGTIAAAIVAGIYGDMALKALDRMHAETAKIGLLSDELAADTKLMLALQTAQLSMSKLSAELIKALPIIQKIEGIWGLLASDLANISKIIQDDITNAPAIIMDLGVSEAITAWKKVSQEANSYALNAYVAKMPTPSEN
ncbi:MAG: alpha-xenorhabdolysin family binary toxin subunit A [Saprospiraceae bacterium]|nr:alpha-xenorhabdolysin family binary toxin subunit A [Saprospiraceae bacterium]